MKPFYIVIIVSSIIGDVAGGVVTDFHILTGG